MKLYIQTTNAKMPTTADIIPVEYTEIKHNIIHSKIMPIP